MKGRKESETRRISRGFVDEKHQKCYVPLKEDAFKLLMTAAHSHASLEWI